MTTSNQDDVDAGWQGEGAAAEPAAEAPADDGADERALEFVTDLMAKMGMDVTVDLLEPEEGDSPDEIRLEVEGPDAGRVIGKKGQVLAAVQYVANRVVNKPPAPRRRFVIVDAEGYQERREETLASMAHRLGKKAVDENKIITFEPMSARDRRIVHHALAKFPGVVTKSDGEGAARRVQIIPVRR